MKDWNVVLTSHMDQERQLLRELEGLGEFHPSGFREVILGKVADIEKFLEILRQFWEEKPFLPELLSTVTPVRLIFPFTLENLVERLKEEALILAPEIGDRAFYVRMKRRGHKGEISSLEVEQALDEYLKAGLTARGHQAHVDFEAPEVILVVETIHNQCGLGLVTREMKERYPFIKVK
jgi:tRNA(Ser,Leu) C12 N-acetylase TAN1